MGGYFSLETEVEEECSTSPNISPLTKLFTFMNDPRSPGNVSRTPILVQEQLVDPRSPGNELVERTPVYGSISTPIVRYKLDNDGYEHSPMVPKEEEETGDNGGYQPSPSIPKEERMYSDEHDHDTKLEDIHEDYDDEIIGEKNEKICMHVDKLSKVCDTEESKKQRTKKDNTLKKRFHARQKSFLKTVLFEPYEELSEDEINVAKDGDTPKKMPLGMKNLIHINRNIPIGKKFSERRFSAGRNNSVNNKLREVSCCDKENKEF